jgi:hypothetical protein
MGFFPFMCLFFTCSINIPLFTKSPQSVRSRGILSFVYLICLGISFDPIEGHQWPGPLPVIMDRSVAEPMRSMGGGSPNVQLLQNVPNWAPLVMLSISVRLLGETCCNRNEYAPVK